MPARAKRVLVPFHGVASYSTMDVCRLTGATYRQVSYWASRGLVAGQARGPGTGSRREWTDAQLDTVRRLVAASERRRHWDRAPIAS